jgi:DNA-binding transcriptional ArsR family regulator
MVLAKNELFDKQEQRCAGLFKALAHPARIQILKYLAETKTCISGDISKELPLGRTTVNQHLKELKRAGLIQGVVSGSMTNYCLNPEKVKELKTLAENFFDEIDIKPQSINC